MKEKETQPEVEITNFDIEVILTETEERGKAIVDYLEKYNGQPVYNDIALAIQFGYQLALKNDTEG